MKRARSVMKATRRNNAEMPIDLSRRRNWFDGEDDTTDKEKTTQGKGTDADTGASNTGGETSPFLKITQKDLEGMLSDRGGQSKKNAYSDLAKSLEIGDVNELNEIVKAHKQAKEKESAAEEANKTELQKSADLLAASTTVQATQAQAISNLLIENAVMKRAPAKEIAPALFRDLLTLLDKSSIEITDGVVDEKTVDAAIDATLEGRDYLKVQASNGQGYGSPNRKSPPKTKTPDQQQPIKQGHMKW